VDTRQENCGQPTRARDRERTLGIDSKIAMAKLTEMGEFVKSLSSSIAQPSRAG
jgi:hypothetical protein